MANLVFTFSMQEEREICGPWVGNDQLLSTHTGAQYGTISTQFDAEVRINFEGTNFMIAHIRVGNIQIALGKEILVIPPRGKYILTIVIRTRHSLV